MPTQPKEQMTKTRLSVIMSVKHYKSQKKFVGLFLCVCDSEFPILTYSHSDSWAPPPRGGGGALFYNSLIVWGALMT